MLYFCLNILNMSTIEDELKSFVIKGFTLPVRAIFDAKTNVETLQAFLKASPFKI